MCRFFRAIALSVLGTAYLVSILQGGGGTPKKKQVTFDGNILYSAYEAKTDQASVIEFIPSKQDLKTWKVLAAVRSYKDINEPKDQISKIILALKAQNSLAKHSVISNKKTGVYVIDFVTWPKDAAFVEFNVFKIEKAEGQGIVEYQYAVREYEKHKEFMMKVGSLRERLVPLMAEKGFKIETTTE